MQIKIVTHIPKKIKKQWKNDQESIRSNLTVERRACLSEYNDLRAAANYVRRKIFRCLIGSTITEKSDSPGRSVERDNPSKTEGLIRSPKIDIHGDQPTGDEDQSEVISVRGNVG